MEEGVYIGPLINDNAIENVVSLIDDAKQHGAKVIAGGEASKVGERFYHPTVLTEVNANMRVFREEIFGPIAPIFKFKTDDEAVSMANDTEFGLAAYLYTQNINRMWRVSEALEYGMVGINEGIITTEVATLAVLKPLVSAGKDRNTGLMNIWKLSICVWEEWRNGHLKSLRCADSTARTSRLKVVETHSTSPFFHSPQKNAMVRG